MGLSWIQRRRSLILNHWTFDCRFLVDLIRFFSSLTRFKHCLFVIWSVLVALHFLISSYISSSDLYIDLFMFHVDESMNTWTWRMCVPVMLVMKFFVIMENLNCRYVLLYGIFECRFSLNISRSSMDRLLYKCMAEMATYILISNTIHLPPIKSSIIIKFYILNVLCALLELNLIDLFHLVISFANVCKNMGCLING